MQRFFHSHRSGKGTWGGQDKKASVRRQNRSDPPNYRELPLALEKDVGGED